MAVTNAFLRLSVAPTGVDSTGVGFAAVTVRATAPDGAPAAGVGMHLDANVRWSHGETHSFLRRSYRATTDRDGVAVFDGVPAGRVDCSVTSTEYTMPWQRVGERRSRRIRVRLAAGEHRVLPVQLLRR